MKYMGSKARHAKEILPIILQNRKEDQWYVEPFVGGANCIDKVAGDRLGSDIHQGLIHALQYIQRTPELLPRNKHEFTEEAYRELKNNPSKYYPGLVGYAGFALSYGGKWFGGWRRDGKGVRDYVMEAYRNAVKQSPGLQGIQFRCCSYDTLDIPPNSIIYCDPPYQNTTKYKDSLDHVKFWQWVRIKAQEGHEVFVSEYTAPEDFTCVWEKQVNNTLTKDTGSKQGIERLFTYDT